jgi:hypothetical protein
MTTTPRPVRRRPGRPRAPWGVLAVLVLAAGCASHPAASARATAARTAAAPCPTAPIGPNTPTPDGVARAALEAMWSVDTATDHGWRDAELRAAPYLAPSYLAELRAAPATVNPGGEWTLWSTHRARTSALARPAGDAPPPDTATRAQRQDLVTLTPVGRDGWHGPARTLIVYTTLTRACLNAPWLLSGVEVAP